MKHFLLLVFTLAYTMNGLAKVTLSHLEVEMQESPIGITTLSPRFSWHILSDRNNVTQKSYQLQLSTDSILLSKGKELVWDSGTIKSDKSVLVPYEGDGLKSRTEYYWRVKVATTAGKSHWSPICKFSTTIVSPDEWKAKWIGQNTATNPGEDVKTEHTRLAARYLRNDFSIKSKVRRATLYICGLGVYEASINGKRVGNDIMAPAVSWYEETAYFNTYDVTGLISSGANAIGITLGNGRYQTPRYPGFIGFGLPRVIAQLEIEYADGTSGIIATDESWRITSNGPIVANNEFDGEEYDARKSLGKWELPGYDDSMWNEADIMSTPCRNLRPQPIPGIKVMDTVKPISVRKVGDKRYIVDMGQNMVGRLAVNLEGKANQPVSLRFAERLANDSMLYMANLRSALCHDIYTPAADGRFSWTPQLTFHGFQYVEIENVEKAPTLSDFTGEVLYDNMATLGKFSTSDTTINQIYKNAFWGIRGNYRSIPTDCPQRDERNGWLGDRATGCYGEAFVFDNALLYSKWLQDIEESQHENGNISAVSPRYWTIWEGEVTWSSAYFNGADMLYRQFGDDSAIKSHYPSMKRWVEFILANSMRNGVVVKDTWGDWCMPPESDELIHSNDPMRKTYPEILASATFYYLLNKMCEYAEISGHQEDIIFYKEEAQKLKKNYNDLFFDSKTASYGNNTVTGNLLSLRNGLVPKGFENKVFDNIVKKTEGDCKGHVSTGVVGIQHLMRGLTEHDREDIALRLTTQRDFPSWGFMIENGATTIWELWNGATADPSMNSCNHVMLLGDLIIWYYENLAGIKNAEGSTAFKHIDMAPCFPDGLDHVEAEYLSPYGKIKSDWTRTQTSLNWEIEIPANTTATITIPKSKLGYASDEAWKYTYGSGKHKITIDKLAGLEDF